MDDQSNVFINRKFFFFLFVVFVGLIVGIAYLSYRQFFSGSEERGEAAVQKLSGDPEEMTEDQILEAVGRVVVLPDEAPTFARVTSTAALSGREIFENAKTGDIVLVFPNSQKVVIFRPDTGQIVEMARVRIDNNDPILEVTTPTPTPEDQEPEDIEEAGSLSPTLSPAGSLTPTGSLPAL